MRAVPVSHQARWRTRLAALAALVLGAVVTVAAIVTATSSTPPRPVTGDALADSLMDKVHSFPRDGTCVRADASRWSCTVPDTSGSGGAEYVVTIARGNCWTAKIRKDYGRNPPVEASGCLS